MKKLWNFIRDALLACLAVIGALFFLILMVLCTPFQFLAYRRSPFSRETGASFRPGVTDQEAYRLYNALRKRGVPISVIAHPKQPLDAHLVCQNTLIVTGIDSLRRKDGQWVIGPHSDCWGENVTIDEAIADEMDDVFDDRPGFEPETAVVLIDRADVAPEDLPQAEADPMFLLYSNDEEQLEVLRGFCTQI